MLCSGLRSEHSPLSVTGRIKPSLDKATRCRILSYTTLFMNNLFPPSGLLAVVRPRIATSARMMAARAGRSAMAPNHDANRSALSRTRIYPTKQQQLSLLPTYSNRPRLACRLRAKAGLCARARRLLRHAAHVRRRRYDLGAVVGWRAASRRSALATSRPARETELA